MFTFGYKNKTGSLLRDVVCIALGVLLVFYPGAAISTIIVKVIGVLLVAFGVIETLALVGAMSLVGMGFMTFVFSGIAILFGIALIFSNFGLRTMGFITGIGLLWYGVSDFVSRWKIRQAMKEYDIRRAEKGTSADSPVINSDGSLKVTDLGGAREVEYTKEK